MDLEIDLCLQFHPSGLVPNERNKREGRKMKRRFLEGVLKEIKPAGFIAVSDGKPVGLLELMPRRMARLNGYMTGVEGDDFKVLTIACLEVALDEDREKVMDMLVSHLVDNLCVFCPFKLIEVGAFSDNAVFHPEWVYDRNGFETTEYRGIAKIKTIEIPCARLHRDCHYESEK